MSRNKLRKGQPVVATSCLLPTVGPLSLDTLIWVLDWITFWMDDPAGVHVLSKCSPNLASGCCCTICSSSDLIGLVPPMSHVDRVLLKVREEMNEDPVNSA